MRTCFIPHWRKTSRFTGIWGAKCPALFYNDFVEFLELNAAIFPVKEVELIFLQRLTPSIVQLHGEKAILKRKELSRSCRKERKTDIDAYLRTSCWLLPTPA